MSSEQETDRRRAWDYHKAADELLAARVSYGLVAHSMFLVSFATIFAAGENKSWWLVVLVEIVIAALGLLYSVVLSFSMWTLNKRMEFLQSTYLRPLDPMYARYLDAAPSSQRWLFRQRNLPKALGIAWAVLLVSAIFG